MKTPDWPRLVIAIALGIGDSILPFHAGYGAAGIWILGTVLAILLLSCGGGVHRVGLTVLAVLPPFVVLNVAGSIYAWTSYRKTMTPSEALSEMLPEMLLTSLLTFGIFVAVPIGIALVVRFIANKKPAMAH